MVIDGLLDSGAEKGEKAGYREEPDDQPDVDDVIHRLLLPIVSNFDSGFLYIVRSRSWVIKNVPKRIKIMLRF
jgi:hypothetical protein